MTTPKRTDPPFLSRVEPSKSIKSAEFEYVSAAATDIRARFQAIRAAQQPAPAQNVKPLRTPRRGT